MNIDERLGAVAQSLELLTHDVTDLKDSVRELRETVREQNSAMLDIVQGIVTIVQQHERRISGLEGQRPS